MNGASHGTTWPHGKLSIRYFQHLSAGGEVVDASGSHFFYRTEFTSTSFLRALSLLLHKFSC